MEMFPRNSRPPRLLGRETSKVRGPPPPQARPAPSTAAEAPWVVPKAPGTLFPSRLHPLSPLMENQSVQLKRSHGSQEITLLEYLPFS